MTTPITPITGGVTETRAPDPPTIPAPTLPQSRARLVQNTGGKYCVKYWHGGAARPPRPPATAARLGRLGPPLLSATPPAAPAAVAPPSTSGACRWRARPVVRGTGAWGLPDGGAGAERAPGSAAHGAVAGRVAGGGAARDGGGPAVRRGHAAQPGAGRPGGARLPWSVVPRKHPPC